jgi:cytoskeletal protein RodZ
MSEEKSLSEKLRAAREQQGKSIEEARRQTGLSSDLLDGLEAGRFDVVEPVYTRMSLRSYAEYLGLEADPLLEQYDRDHPPAVQPTPVKVPAQETTTGATSSESGSWLPIDAGVLRIVALAISALAVFLLILYIFDDQTDAPTPTDALPERTPPSARRAAPLPPPAPSADREEPAVESTSPETTADLEPTIPEEAAPSELPTATADSLEAEAMDAEPSPVAQMAAEEPVDDGEPPPQEDAPAGLEADTAEIPEPNVAPVEETPAPVEAPPQDSPVVSGDDAQIAEDPEELAPPVTDTASLPTPMNADSLFQLEVEAVDSTWVQIRWDGSGIFEGTIPRGERRLWQAGQFFLVRSGRAHGLRYWFQGQLLGQGRLGDPTRVLRFRAAAEGITLLGPDLQPLNDQPDIDDQP